MRKREQEMILCAIAELEEGQRLLDAALAIPQPTALEALHRYWRKVSPDDRLRFLVEMLTPNERRALQLGLEEEASHA